MSTIAPQHDPSRLEALLESAQLLHSSLHLEDLLRHLLRTVMGRLLVGKGLIAVGAGADLRVSLVRGLPRISVGELFNEESARAAGVEFILPIGDDENPIGILGIGHPPTGGISPEEMEFLSALLGIAASGIANARAHEESSRLNQSLAQKVHDLRTLLDLARGLASKLEPDAVASLLTLTLAGHWAVRKYGLVAWKDGHPPVSRQKGIALPDVELLRSAVSDLPEATRVEDLETSALKDALREQQAVVLFPLRSADAVTGIVVLGPRPGQFRYTQADLDFGSGLVSQAEVAFENAWYVRETLERKKMEQELALAASIQEGLFPEHLPRIAGYDLAARNRPALQCGGDYYDVLTQENGSGGQSYLLCVADVSGKGLPASLLMSNMQASLRALFGRTASLVELAARTNELLHASTPSSKFVTAILIEFDPMTGAGRFVSAGHNDCILVKGSSDETGLLKSTGLPLGMMPTSMLEMLGKQYEENSFQLEPGDLLALYSDGVPEAYDEQENEWGEARFVECLRAAHTEGPSQVVDRVFEELDAFVGTAPQHDDITLLVLKRSN